MLVLWIITGGNVRLELRIRKRWFHASVRPILNACAWVRGLFPQAYAVRAFCCDTGWARESYPVLTWNARHAARVLRECDRGSDGPCRVGRISLTEYAQMRREQRWQYAPQGAPLGEVTR